MLKINSLSVSIDNNKILNNLNMEFNNGEITGIIGKNGCGKSTLLKSIESLIPYSGEIIYNDTNLHEIKIKDRAKIISYLPQNRPTPNISARIMVEHGRFPYLSFDKKLTKKDKDIVNDAIVKTNIENLKYKKLDEMSGGEVQKVYIATTIAQETDIILLDEPTNHLDLESQIEILSLIKKLKQENKTIIIVMHDLLQAFTYCDKLYVIDEHNIKASGNPKDLINNNSLKDIFKYHLTRDDDPNSLYGYKLIKE